MTCQACFKSGPKLHRQNSPICRPCSVHYYHHNAECCGTGHSMRRLEVYPSLLASNLTPNDVLESPNNQINLWYLILYPPTTYPWIVHWRVTRWAFRIVESHFRSVESKMSSMADRELVLQRCAESENRTRASTATLFASMAFLVSIDHEVPVTQIVSMHQHLG